MKYLFENGTCEVTLAKINNENSFWYEYYGFHIFIMLNGTYCVTNPWNNLSPTEFVLYEEAVENIYNQLRNKTMPYDMLSEYKEKYKLIEKSWTHRIYSDEDNWKIIVRDNLIKVMNPKEYVYTKAYKNMYTAIADLEYRKRNSKTIKKESDLRGIDEKTGLYLSRYYALKERKEGEKVMQVGEQFKLIPSEDYYKLRSKK